MMEKEKWLVVVGHDDYAVSSFGRVKRVTSGPSTYAGKLVKPYVVSDGYYQVDLNREKIRINRLVLGAFVRSPIGNEQANHLDGDKSNNALFNLEWATPSENMAHAYRTGIRSPMRGENHPMSKLTNNCVRRIKRMLEDGVKIVDICKEIGISRYQVSGIKNGHIWTWVE